MTEYAKYKRISEEIKVKIEEGLWQPGEKLPPDSVLFKQFDANKNTMAKALGELVNEGLIIRKRGSGTYIATEAQGVRVPKKIFRIGVLCNYMVGKNKKLIGLFYWLIIHGILKELNFKEGDSTLLHCHENEATEEVWSRNDLDISVHVMGECINKINQHPPFEDVKKRNFDGLILVGFTKTDWSERIINIGIPAVLVDTSFESKKPNIDNVHSDSHSAFVAAGDYFIKHKLLPVLFLGHKHYDKTLRENLTEDDWKKIRSQNEFINPESIIRANAVKQSFDSHKLLPSTLQTEHLLSSRLSMETLIKKIIKLPKHRRPKAIISHDLANGLSVAAQLKKSNINVEVAGATTFEHDEICHPIESNASNMGAVAGALMISRLQNPLRPPIRAKLEFEFKPNI